MHSGLWITPHSATGRLDGAVEAPAGRYGKWRPVAMNPSSSNPAALRLVPETPAEAGVVESYRRLAPTCSTTCSPEQSLDALLERIADTVGELIPYDDLHIYEANETARTLKAVFVRGEWAEEVLADRPITFGEGITGWAVEHREPVLANQAHLDPRVRFVANTPIEPESLVSVPLIARGRLKGTLNIYRVGERAAFTEAEFQLAARFGDAAALALDNAHIRASLELQAQTDGAHRPAQPPGLPRAAAQGAPPSLGRARDRRARDARPGRLQARERRLRPRDRRHRARGGRRAAARRRCARVTPICRIGGEEFAIVVPDGDLDIALALARATGRAAGGVGLRAGGAHQRLARRRDRAAPRGEPARARRLRRGGDDDREGARQEPRRRLRRGRHRAPEATGDRRDDGRSIAHLKLLQSASAKLSRLNETAEIGETIADELRRLFDYHNCRVFVREGEELRSWRSAAS